MVAKQTTSNGTILTETVGANMSIVRTPTQLPGQAPGVDYSIYMAYTDHDYLVDETGAKVRLMSQGSAQVPVNFTPQQVGAFFMTPIKKSDGTDTVLGEFIADLWDQAIRDHIAYLAPLESPAQP